MSTLNVANIQSTGSGFNDVVLFKNSGGTENGTLCRAWVNFNGTGTVAIRDDFNVDSITDEGTGAYTVTFSNAMPDANYAPVVTTTSTATSGYPNPYVAAAYVLTTSVRLIVGKNVSTNDDVSVASVAIFS